MNVSLKTDIILATKNQTFLFKAGDLIRVDLTEGIAYHPDTDTYFTISREEISYLN